MVIVAAVDGSDRSSDVVEQAKELADAFDEPIHVVHVLSTSAFADLERTSVDETGTAIDMDRVRETAAEIAEEASADLAPDSKTVGLVGDPAKRIVDYADKRDARYVVVTGRKRSPTGKVIFGSVSQTIILNASAPVVVSIDQE